MKFSKAAPSQITLLDPRWTSENGVWEVGVHKVMFGKRVRAGIVGKDWCTIDYCAGGDEEFLKELIVVIMMILESFDEFVKESDVEAVLPRFTIKPINKDPYCWAALKRLMMERLISSGRMETELR